MENAFYGAFDFEHLPGKRPENDYRSPFQIDRDRVLFSPAFRQLQSKTQVFQSGAYDFYRTRLTHTIEVARIARSIAEFLNGSSARLRAGFFLDADLVEAVGLAHDLGHPPFGHIGERRLNELMQASGGFEGNAQSLRIVTELIYERPERSSGMKPTRAFLDGILKYSSLYSEVAATLTEGKYPKNHFIYDEQVGLRSFIYPELDWSGLSESERAQLKSIECQIMDWADDTAYSLHDIVDGIKAGFISAESLSDWRDRQKGLSSFQEQILEDLIGEIRSGGYEPRTGIRIGEFIQACSLEPVETPLSAQSNRHRFRLEVDQRVREICSLHKRIAIDLIFRAPPLQQIEYRGGHLLTRLFAAYCDHAVDDNPRPLNILPEPVGLWVEKAASAAEKRRLVCDHLASLTDGQAIRAYKRLFDPDAFGFWPIG
jgi:dGTPase